MADFVEIEDRRRLEDDAAMALERQLLACEASLGISLCVHDHCGFFRDGLGQPLLLDRNVHRHPFCRAQRDATFDRCNRHCVDEVHRHSSSHSEAFLTGCWKGLREIVVPLQHDGLLLATLFAGGWRRPGRRPSWRGCPDPRQLRVIHDALPALSPEQAADLRTQLQRWGEGLVHWVLKLQQGDDDDDRRNIIRRFIFRHAHERLRLDDLAARLQCSASRCSHLVSGLMGCSFQELLLRERMERACVLLRGSPHTLERIAERCGFSDVYYFSRCFRQRMGQPPGAYRRRFVNVS